MLNSKEKKLIKELENDKKELINELYSLEILPNNLLEEIKKINSNLHNFSIKLFSKDYTPIEIEKYLSKCLEHKVYINSINIDIDYLKIQLEAVKGNSKMDMLKEKYNSATGELNKEFLKEELDNKLLSINSYFSILKDIKQKVRNLNDTLDKFFIVITTQMKSDTANMLNADRIHK